uniref:glucan endo-1,3-beta-D-glucosidase n=1 Tax=Brassica campestris TaxID=3711 RepID=A0A3P6CC54_BRACM|nr:unnamed protein product [Brassica rapa]
MEITYQVIPKLWLCTSSTTSGECGCTVPTLTLSTLSVAPASSSSSTFPMATYNVSQIAKRRPAHGSETTSRSTTMSVSTGLSIPVSTTTYMGAFTDTYPPSRGRFSDEYRNFLQPVIGFLVSKRSPLLVNIYTYFGYKNGDVSLEFALFKPSNNEFNDPNNQLHHQNLFDANLDSVYAALEKSGGGSLEVVVSESGWPTQGGPGASVGNAEAYINNLIQHVKSGSPRRPGKAIETYIFAMFDENEKPNDETERYFGLLSKAIINTASIFIVQN